MSDSDNPMEVYECEQNMNGDIYFPGKPGRYVRVEDVEQMVQEAYEEGMKTCNYFEGSAFIDIEWPKSEAAALLRAMKGE